ncbi:hypothetical protein LTR62_007637 [Meristemomyces frigidus]|uniref:Double-strand break repair protein n=1 Tax=Meristemomyces frigidus TaxID=1508187 RepID=A0AAN7TBX2_9PEZI|nr:hypothetical protein LTR62_007637 [Meristemomyces frigidus]
MPEYTAADTIRVLISTDNHVGYNERDSIRGDDSWKSFHEVMCLAKENDVDMVLLAGDLFHENKPSRKSMYQVMRSLRMNCYGDKPCELEMLSDASEVFAGAFNHVNYEDPDINVAIPVFSIHGNHDDPAGEGEGHLAALDLLQMSGLVNYYGRTPESDNIQIKPVLLQKGKTKLALYGMSNVRDERLFRTFRDGGVKFFQPGTQKDDWFNLMSVHQNHHAHTASGYLPENFLPSFMDLIVWGHEHECLIEPKTNPEKGFRVMQPGSSVATSLVEGEAVPKKIAIISIKGKDFDLKTILLKTVRPFVHREVELAKNREMKKLSYRADDVRPKITRYLDDMVNELIEEAREEWIKTHEDENEEDFPKPLIRLRVDYSAPEGGHYEIDNAQRFSNRFVEKVANVNDVVQFHRKRHALRTAKGAPDMPEEDVLAAQMEMDAIKVGQLVDEFLAAQSLTILPQNNFSDAVTQFVDKDDRDAMTQFVEESLQNQISHLIGDDEDDEVDEEKVAEMMEKFKENLEERFKNGEIKRKGKSKGRRKPQPEYWDSDADGPWEDNIASFVRNDEDDEADVAEDAPAKTTAKTVPSGRGRGRGATAAAGASRAATAAAKKTKEKMAMGSSATSRKKQPIFEEDDDHDEEPDLGDDDDDVIMTNNHNPILIDDDDEEDDELFVKPAAKKKAAARYAAPAKTTKAAPSRATKATSQSQLGSFFGGNSSRAAGVSAQSASGGAKGKTLPKRVAEPSDDEISDDDAFEPPPTATAASARVRSGRR